MPSPRNLNAPVYKQEPLNNYPTLHEDKAALLFGLPSIPANTQSLQLATNGDVLIGLAGNGAILILSLEACSAPAPRLTFHAAWA